MSAVSKPETPEVFYATVDEYLFYEETSAERYDYFVGKSLHELEALNNTTILKEIL